MPALIVMPGFHVNGKSANMDPMRRADPITPQAPAERTGNTPATQCASTG
jgi:hypothetical protein